MPGESSAATEPIDRFGVCTLCRGLPVGSATRWIGEEGGPDALPCPGCGVTTLPEQVAAELRVASDATRPVADHAMDVKCSWRDGWVAGNLACQAGRPRPVPAAYPHDEQAAAYAAGYARAVADRATTGGW